MKTIWQALAWKEWHEHKWKLAAVTAILLSVLALCYKDDESTIFNLGVIVLVYGMVPISLFLGAAEAGGESTRGTLRFTQALPVSMPRVAACKLAFGLATCITPIFVSIGAILAWYLVWGRFDAEANRDLMNTLKTLHRPLGIDHDITVWLLGSTTIGVSAAATIFIWTLAWGVSQKTEVRAGIVALSTGLIFWSSFVAAAELIGYWISSAVGKLAVTTTAGTLPGGLPVSLGLALTGTGEGTRLAIIATIVAAAFYLILVASFIRRFGVTKPVYAWSKSAAQSSTTRCDWLPQPFRSPMRAMIWKQCRESGPIVLFGVLTVLAIFIGYLMVFSGSYWSTNRSQLAELLISITIPVGFVLALCVGIRNFDQDMSEKINEFWRSRPVRVDIWFWSKYLTGLAFLTVALSLPIVIAVSYAYSSEETTRPFLTNAFALMIVSFQLAIYAAASATIIVIRQPIYAAILGVGALLIGIAGVAVISETEFVHLERAIYVIEFVTALLATLVAWLAIRYDWGANGRS
jgi:hypothetical protein